VTCLVFVPVTVPDVDRRCARTLWLPFAVAVVSHENVHGVFGGVVQRTWMTPSITTRISPRFLRLSVRAVAVTI